MNYIILSSLLSVCLLNADYRSSSDQKKAASIAVSYEENKDDAMRILFGDQPGPGRMSAAEFKYQKFCRAEVAHFDFDAKFSIISATVYFSGANFKNGVEKGFLTSSSLKPVETQMLRCIPGTMVVFDDIKVVGPDKEIRTIQGLSLLLY